MYFLKACLFIVTIGFLVGCHYKNNKGAAGGGGPADNIGASQLTFAFVTSEVIGPKCLECHSAAGGNRAGINLETYGNVKAQIAAIQSTVATDFMPFNRAPLTTAQKNILNNWIAAGAPELASVTTPNPTPKPNPSPVDPPAQPALDWLTVRTLVIEPKCLGCHSAPGNRGGVNLETYQNALSNIEDVDKAIRDGSMPRRSTLTPEQKKLIIDWIQAGAPEFVTQ